jgi:hypothetical protein
MGVVMIRCPRTGHEISTGIEMARSDFQRAPVFFAHAHCPICRIEHEWFAKDAWVCEGSRPPLAALVDS